MPFSRFIVPVVLAFTLILTPAALGTAYAADSAPPADEAVMDHQLTCEDGVCSLRVDLGTNTPGWLPATGFALSILEDNLHILPDGAGISVSDGLALDMPIGKLKLVDAKIDLSLGEDGRVESFYGTAQLPTPSLGLFGRATSKKPIVTTIGYDVASALPTVNAPLDPERKYLFFDLAAGTELTASLDDGSDGALWLSIPEGQRATIVIDPLERFAYIDGNVTMRYSGSMAFLTQLLDPAETIDILSGELPLRHEATVHVTGVVADQLVDSRLEFEGRYSVDGGKMAEWLHLNGEPLALEGGVVITDEGLLGTGIVRSSLLPENLWDSAVQAQIFVPFSTDYRDAYAALNTRVEIPVANISADGYARLDGALDVIADGSFSAPWRSDETDAIASTDNVDIEDNAAETAESEASLWSKALDVTMEGAQAGLEYAGKPASAAVDWVKDAAGSGYDSASTGLEWSIDMASNQWCSTTGFCNNNVLAEESATAMK